ncbi:MAG: HAMP domain-containing histidine kinase [Gemmataceae bacterium]|nr:HAMP domain-containing histidine kinase [Gemmataceae bacterium]
MRLSLRYRLLWPLVLLVFGEAGATAWTAWSAARHAEEQLAAQQAAVARTLAEPRSTFPLTARVLEQMKGLSGAEFILRLPGGGVESTLTVNPETLRLLEEGPYSDDDLFLGPVQVLEEQQYRCRRIVLKPPHPQAGAELFILYPETLRRQAIAEAIRPLLWLGSVSGLCAFALMWTLSAQLLRRLRQLHARTRLIAAGDLRPQPLPAADDELRDLAVALNDMAGQLAQLHQQLQHAERLRLLGQFSSGLAHQLRNAAAGARLAIQLYLQENPALPDPEPLQVALRQLTRLEASIRQFLMLGRPPALALRSIDGRDLLDQIVPLYLPQARHAGVVLHWQRPDTPCPLTADPEQLHQAVANLLTNALEAAGEGGWVRLQCRYEPPTVILEVCDSGPGPPPQLAERLFDPFVTGKPEGIGLGLAVAKRLIEAHGGSLCWQRRPDHTCFIIRLPSQPPVSPPP